MFRHSAYISCLIVASTFIFESSIHAQPQGIPLVTLAQTTTSFAGSWSSDWGPVTLDDNLKGSWDQGVNIGKFTSGSYDPVNNQIVFQYYQPWNKMYGTTTMTVSDDGNTLSGGWAQQQLGQASGSGGSGEWTMHREYKVGKVILYAVGIHSILGIKNSEGSFTFGFGPVSWWIFSDGYFPLAPGRIDQNNEYYSNISNAVEISSYTLSDDRTKQMVQSLRQEAKRENTTHFIWYNLVFENCESYATERYYKWKH